MEKATFNVPSISCSTCSNKIKEGIKTLQGVGDISVDLKSQVVNVAYDPRQVQSAEIKGKISSMGFEVI